MANVKLYYTIASPPARAVILTLKALNVPYDLIDINILAGEHKSEQYIKLNPEGTVPVLIDNDFAVLDSHVINIYLVNKFAKDDKLYPKDIKARSIVDHRLFYDTGVLFPALKNFAQKVFREKADSITPEVQKQYKNAYGTLEKFLKGNQYIAGKDSTIADFSVMNTVTAMALFVPVEKEAFPLLTAYIERCKSTLPNFTEVTNDGINAFLQLIEKTNPTFPLPK